MEPGGLDSYTGPIPLFPLPDVILFPHAVLPLHIYEPRYRTMLADALRGDRLIAMARLEPWWEGQYEETPPVAPLVGIGRVLRDVKLPDGRSNILLQGVVRARIDEEIPSSTRPYRVARVTTVPDPDSAGDEKVRLTLLAVYSAILRHASKGTPVDIETGLPVGALSDLLAPFIDADKIALFEELDPMRRARAVVDGLKASPAASLPFLSGLQASDETRWPPAASQN